MKTKLCYPTEIQSQIDKIDSEISILMLNHLYDKPEQMEATTICRNQYLRNKQLKYIESQIDELNSQKEKILKRCIPVVSITFESTKELDEFRNLWNNQNLQTLRNY